MKTIVLVDDDAEFLASTKDYLDASLDDIDIRTYDNPIESLRNIQIDNPHIVITDISMPRVQGNDYGAVVKQFVDSDFVVYISGNPVDKIPEEIPKESFYKKPLSDRFIEKIQELLRREHAIKDEMESSVTSKIKVLYSIWAKERLNGYIKDSTAISMRSLLNLIPDANKVIKELASKEGVWKETLALGENHPKRSIKLAGKTYFDESEEFSYEIKDCKLYKNNEEVASNVGEWEFDDFLSIKSSLLNESLTTYNFALNVYPALRDRTTKEHIVLNANDQSCIYKSYKVQFEKPNRLDLYRDRNDRTLETIKTTEISVNEGHPGRGVYSCTVERSSTKYWASVCSNLPEKFSYNGLNTINIEIDGQGHPHISCQGIELNKEVYSKFASLPISTRSIDLIDYIASIEAPAKLIRCALSLACGVPFVTLGYQAAVFDKNLQPFHGVQLKHVPDSEIWGMYQFIKDKGKLMHG